MTKLIRYRVYGTYHLYQERIKSDQEVLRYGSGQTKSVDRWNGRTDGLRQNYIPQTSSGDNKL